MPLISAVQINNTIFYTGDVINSNLFFYQSNYYFDYVNISESKITFLGFTSNPSLYKLDIEIPNDSPYTTYYDNSHPNYTGSGINLGYIFNLTDSNFYLQTSYSCKDITQLVYTTSEGTSTIWNGKNARALCSGGLFTLKGIMISPGLNTIYLNMSYNPADICTGFFDAGMSYMQFIIILIIVSIGGILILFMKGGEDGGDINDTIFLAGMIIVGAFVLSIGMIIINSMSGC